MDRVIVLFSDPQKRETGFRRGVGVACVGPSHALKPRALRLGENPGIIGVPGREGASLGGLAPEGHQKTKQGGQKLNISFPLSMSPKELVGLIRYHRQSTFNLNMDATVRTKTSHTYTQTKHRDTGTQTVFTHVL